MEHRSNWLSYGQESWHLDDRPHSLVQINHISFAQTKGIQHTYACTNRQLTKLIALSYIQQPLIILST